MLTTFILTATLLFHDNTEHTFNIPFKTLSNCEQGIKLLKQRVSLHQNGGGPLVRHAGKIKSLKAIHCRKAGKREQLEKEFRNINPDSQAGANLGQFSRAQTTAMFSRDQDLAFRAFKSNALKY